LQSLKQARTHDKTGGITTLPQRMIDISIGDCTRFWLCYSCFMRSDIHPVTYGRMRIAACWLIVLICCTSTGASADEPLKLGFVIRSGMAELVNGVPIGTYLPLVADIARTAHLQVQWMELPQVRLIAEAQADTPDYCAVGIYKNAERAATAKFTHAFFHDKPLVVVTIKSKEALIRKHASFAALTADTSLKIGLIDGYSYGTHLDPIVWHMPNADHMTGSTMLNVRKLLAGRFDYLLGSGEEASHTADTTAPDESEFVKIAFADLAPGEARYLMCSTAVSDATIARLNTAIHALHLDSAEAR
jgi:polar amino acid transport system substrate-binding protein